jgi:hypothetical protein
MDKGIRPYCNNLFVQLNEQRRRGEMTDRQFRKEILYTVVEEFNTTVAAAATHYNHSFKLVKSLNPELVSGLGRPEGKNNGGRKKKAVAVAVPAPVLLLGYTPAPAPVEEVEEVVQEKTYTVTRVKDGAVIATGLVLTDAEALIAKAAAAKKAKLVFA